MTPDLLQALAAIVGPDHLSTRATDREAHSHDRSAHLPHPPDAVAWPADTGQVRALLRLAHDQHLPVVGWGIGSSIEGNPIPVHGGLVVDFARMDRILNIYPKDFQATVQPGVRRLTLHEALAPHRLFFTPDPGADATIGGMIANNAAGTRTVRYGATKDNILALEVVLADGTVLRTGSRSIKQSAGYDLTHVFVGSEGTLGLITKATLKLHPIPRHYCAVTVAFPDIHTTVDTLVRIMSDGLDPAAMEFLDARMIRMLNAQAGLGYPAQPHMFMEFSGPSETGLAETLLDVKAICLAAGGTALQAGLGRKGRDQLWATRHRLFEHLLAHYPGHTFRLTDVAVPRSNYPALVAFADETMRELDIKGGMVGHAGDGNLHTNAFFLPDDRAAARNADTLNARMVKKALTLEGTCTGEHGVGIGKRHYMVAEHGEAGVGLMRQFKQLLDPHHILNPGKIL